MVWTSVLQVPALACNGLFLVVAFTKATLHIDADDTCTQVTSYLFVIEVFQSSNARLL